MVVMVRLDCQGVGRLGWETNYAQRLLRNNDCWQRTSFALLSVVVQQLLQRRRLRCTLALFLQTPLLTYVDHLTPQLAFDLEGRVNLDRFELELFPHRT